MPAVFPQTKEKTHLMHSRDPGNQQTSKQSVFFSKSVTKSVKVVKRGESCAREARRACEARGKKPTVRFPYNDFVPARGFKNVVELSKNCSQLHPLCEFDTLGD